MALRGDRSDLGRTGAWLGLSVGAGLAAWAATGRRLARSAGPPAVRRGVTILRPQREIYELWRRPTRLAEAAARLESVEPNDDGSWTWKLTGRRGATVAWRASPLEEREPEALVWRSDSASLRVDLRPAPGDRGTELQVAVEPASARAERALRLAGEWPARQLNEDLRRLKQLLEAGEIATTDRQPAGRRSLLGALAGREERTPS